MVKPSQMKKKI